MENYYITNDNDIFVFFEIISQTSPRSILDVGMFLKRIGAVTRAKILNVFRRRDDIRKDAYSLLELCDFIPAVLTGCRSLKDFKASHCGASAKHLWSEQWGGFPPDEFFDTLDPSLTVIRHHMVNSCILAVEQNTQHSRKMSVIGIPRFGSVEGDIGASAVNIIRSSQFYDVRKNAMALVKCRQLLHIVPQFCCL